jgi:hypothetical protein
VTYGTDVLFAAQVLTMSAFTQLEQGSICYLLHHAKKFNFLKNLE